MKKLYRTRTGANTGSYIVNPRPSRECAHVEVFNVTKKGELILDAIHGTAFDETLGGLRALTPDEAHHFAAESNSEQGWKVGDKIAGEFVELQG